MTSLIGFFAFFIGAINIGLGTLVFIKGPKKGPYVFYFLLNAAYVLWAIPYGIWVFQKNGETALFWSRMLNLGAVFIPLFYFSWIVSFLKINKKRLLYFLGFITFLFSLFSFSPFFIKGTLLFQNVKYLNYPTIYWHWPQANFLYSIFLIEFFGLVIYALLLLFKSYYKTNDILFKQQIKWIVVGSLFGFGGGATNFPLMYGVNLFSPLGMFVIGIQPVLFAVAMLKYRLFNIKVIATELSIFALWIFLLFRLLVDQTLRERFIDGGLFILSIFVGVILIRSVIKEVEQRERLEILTKQLESANVELKRLDAAKSEFVSIVSHQLRTPLTAVKGYISMIKEGTYGKITAIQQDVLEKVFQSGERLIAFINDLLNLNRIEDGRITYAFAAVDLAQMVDEVVFDLKAIAELKKLKLTWIKPHGLPMAWADADKVRQVVINFIDNSIKYTEQGSVNVGLKLENDFLVFAVKDTGVGMDAEEKTRLFKKFERGEGGKLLYTGGTGLGLYVAKLMADAHHGEISGVSEGKSKGSTFTIKIPTEEFAKKNNINQNSIDTKNNNT
ncbi:MAG: ATP-binding protein [Patescibacteria group bacterium]